MGAVGSCITRPPSPKILRPRTEGAEYLIVMVLPPIVPVAVWAGLCWAGATIVVAILRSALAVQPPCGELGVLKRPNPTITSATRISAGPINAGGNAPPIQAPARCVVKAVASPTSDSEIKFEVWLPTEGWNGKYQ